LNHTVFLIGFCFVFFLLGSDTTVGQESSLRTDWLGHLELLGLGPSNMKSYFRFRLCVSPWGSGKLAVSVIQGVTSQQLLYFVTILA
jgi:hypothetical protein